MMSVKKLMKGKWVTGALLVLCTLAMGKLNIEAWNTFSTEKSYADSALAAPQGISYSPQVIAEQYSLAEELVLSVRDFANTLTKLSRIMMTSEAAPIENEVNTTKLDCATFTASYPAESASPVRYEL